jgi:predicted RNase H-like HicB family nuclease
MSTAQLSLTPVVDASYTLRMEMIHYIPTREEDMKTYIFQAEIEQDDDGRWSAWIEALLGRAVRGYTKEEALEALQDAAQAYIEVLTEKGRSIPVAKGVETRDALAVAVTV